MSLEAFLAWEEQQELRWEFDGFEPVAMTGGTSEHSAIERNLILAVGGRLRGKPCQLYISNLKIFVAGSIRYPDAFVVCSPVPRGTLVVSDPVVVFEVFSPSTASTDIGVKNEEYRDTPSVRRYVMLAQDRQLRPCSRVWMSIGLGISFQEARFWICPRSVSRFRWRNYTQESISNQPSRLSDNILY